MARAEAIALGGYYPLPRHLVPRIAHLVQPFIGKDSQVSFMDPCAGDGEAVLALMKLLAKGSYSRLYSCEMEASRYDALCRASGARLHSVHGDAFRLTYKRGSGVSLLYLNPPYDFDRVHGRLENKFLQRFTGALADQGILLFVVPFYALEASAIWLATHYGNVHCFKFPDQDFAGFKQVVLFAQRVESRLQPDQEIQSQVERFASGEGLLELPYLGAKPLAAMPAMKSHPEPLTEWAARPVDIAGLLMKVRPWVHTGRNGSENRVPGILPELRIDELLLRTYPVATPPRPAHIASGIASGIFNGSRVTSGNPALPPLLVKGVFNQEYRTVEEKRDKHGDVKGWVQVQQPKLVVTVLDLSTYRYHTLNNEGEFSGSVDTLSVSGLLKFYGHSLMRVMEDQCPILYDPRRDRDLVPLAPTARNPFLAQNDAAKALVKLLGGPGVPLEKRSGKSAILLGEIGSGKTTVSLVVAKTVGARRPIVVCPPHLLKSWSDEIAAVIPEAEVRILTDIDDLEAVASVQSDKMIVSILSRETAKLGHGWISVGDVCPKCGALTPAEDHAKKRSRCEAKTLIGSGLVSRTILDMMHHLKRFAPKDDTIQSLLKHRWGIRSLAWHKANVQKFVALPAGYLDAVIQELKNQSPPDGYADETLRRAVAWCLIAVNDQAQIAAAADHFLGNDHHSDQEFGRQLLYLLTPSSALQTELVERHRKVAVSYHYSPWSGFEKAVEDVQNGSSYIRIADLPVSWEDGKLMVGGVQAASLEAACRAVRALTYRSNLHWSDECGEFLFQAVPEPRRIALAKHIQARHPATFDFLVLDECFVRGTKVSGRVIEAIQVGDLIDSYDESTKTIRQSRVTRKWIKTPSALVKVSFSDGTSLVCTPNHPVMTEQGWVPAGRLTGKELVLSLGGAKESGTVDGTMSDLPFNFHVDGKTSRQVTEKRLVNLQSELCRQSWCSQTSTTVEGDVPLVQVVSHVGAPPGLSGSQEGVRVLQPELCTTREERRHRASQRNCHETERGHLLEAHEREQPNARPSDCGKNATEVDRSNVFGAWGEREGHQATGGFSGGVGLGDGNTNLHCSGNGAVSESTALLQSRHRARGLEIGNRGGRTEPQTEEMAVLGSSQDQRLGSIRVESVEVLERGGDGRFGGLCPDGFVYNLEVEGTHTYFAEGVLVHNCHEYGNEGSAQEKSAHRLTGLGLPTIQMSGSIMNGYAEHLFMTMWSISLAFRQEFSRDDKQRFIDRYGYRKRLVTERADDDEQVISFGSVSDRETTTERVIGNAPGVLPLFLLRHLLPLSVTLHKADLALDLPRCVQERHLIDPGPGLQSRYERLKKALVARIKKDTFTPDLAGKLFGQLAELPSFLDRATVDLGNSSSGAYEIRYPESVGGDVVVSQPGLPATTILPKEQWMLDRIKQELAEGRNVMVFSWHVSLLPRIAGLISGATGQKVPILYADKVGTAKRQEWITKNVVQKNARVMVCNPVVIQTGLNNLVHFSTEIWLENPAANPVVYRQAAGRVDRIGQTQETRILFPIYKDTLQVQLHELLLHKVVISTSTDGLDPESALLASGVGPDDYLTGLSIGKQLWAMLSSATTHREPVDGVTRRQAARL